MAVNRKVPEMKAIASLKLDDIRSRLCEGCIHGKQHRESLPAASTNRATEPLERVHSDVCGPMSTSSFGGAKYFVTFIDDFTGYITLYPIRKKDEVQACFERFRAEVEKQTGRTIRCLRSDNGGEYVSIQFEQYLQQHGIRHDKSVPYVPQQNGVAERANRTLVESARSALHHRGLSRKYWAEAVSTAAFVRNRVPNSRDAAMSPYEKLFGRKPSLLALRAFGCDAYAFDPQHGKLDSKTRKLVFVGYSEQHKGYRLLHPTTHKLVIARHVIFDERGQLSRRFRDAYRQLDDPHHDSRSQPDHVQWDVSDFLSYASQPAEPVGATHPVGAHQPAQQGGHQHRSPPRSPEPSSSDENSSESDLSDSDSESDDDEYESDVVSGVDEEQTVQRQAYVSFASVASTSPKLCWKDVLNTLEVQRKRKKVY